MFDFEGNHWIDDYFKKFLASSSGESLLKFFKENWYYKTYNNMITLISKASTGKLRVAQAEYHWDDSVNGYVITRTTGQYNGKQTEAPLIIINKGKAKRTVEEQVELEFNAIIKKYKDKGYKELEGELENFSEEDLYEIVGEVVTGQAGVLKPMLAKQADKVTNKKVFDKLYYGSRKINGVRCLIYRDSDGILRSSSRGAINYDLAISDILKNQSLIDLFEEFPDLILDGEIYKHGLTLNQISGICRKQEEAEEKLEFYWYDIANPTLTFAQRYEAMQIIAKRLELDEFDPYKEWNDSDLRIQLLPQVQMTGYDKMMEYHNQYVSEGWEGLVIRNIDSLYGPNKRTNDMIKIKVYHDSEYEIVGIEDGELRPIEDEVFIMKTPTGQEFKAKPMGDRKQRQWYHDHINELIGKMGTLKWFEMSGKEGSEIPQQPIFICVRDYE